MITSAAEWCLVLPGNSPAARGTARVVVESQRTPCLAERHGKPWIIGQALQPPVTATVGSLTAAVLGTHQITPTMLQAALRACAKRGAFASLLRFPGSYHVVVTGDEYTWMSGDAAGVRHVYASAAAGTTVLGTHARPLAQLGGQVRLDPLHLAAQLLVPVAPLALAQGGTSPYRGVRALPPGRAARVDRQGALAVEQWWHVPDDEDRLPAAASRLRTALREALAVRTVGDDTVACELSGGLDSTSLSFLAHQQAGARLLNLTRASVDPGNDDQMWATRAASSQGSRHVILPSAVLPRHFDGIEAPFQLDAPSPTAVSPERSMLLWSHALGAGARVLLSGRGGDEVMSALPTYLAAAKRRDRATARHQVRGWAALAGTSTATIRAQAADPGAYPLWLANSLTGPSAEAGWEAQPRVPAWLTGVAREELAQALRELPEEPEHDRPHQHAAIHAVRSMAGLNRLQAEAASRYGLTTTYPFADRAVLEAALSCRAEGRRSPFAPRPLLTAAMDGIVPPECLARRTKAGYNRETAQATAARRAQLAALFTGESALADLHLIDPQPVAEALAHPERLDQTSDLQLHTTIVCEVWARIAQGQPVPALPMEMNHAC